MGFFGDVVDTVTDVGGSVVGGIGDTAGDIVDAGVDQLASGAGQIGFGAGEDVLNTASEIGDDAFGAVGDFVSGNPIGSIEELGNLGGELTDQVASGAGAVGLGGVQDVAEDVSDFGQNPIQTGLEQLASGAGQIGVGGVEDVLNTGADVAGSALEKLMAGDTTAALKDVSGEVIERVAGGGPQASEITKKKAVARARTLIKREGSLEGAIDAAENAVVRKILQQLKARADRAGKDGGGVATDIYEEDRRVGARSFRAQDQKAQSRQTSTGAGGGLVWALLIGLGIFAAANSNG